MKLRTKIRNCLVEHLPFLILLGVGFLIAAFLMFGTASENGYITFDGRDAKISDETKEWIDGAHNAYIEYAKEAIPVVITGTDGAEVTISAPTIDTIDGGEVTNEVKCEGQECGQGAFIYAPTDTYEHFRDYTLGKCWDVDGYYGAQCWDLASLHSMNYTNDGRVFSTCGTGAAKGMWDCKEQNAGTEYDLVYDIYSTNVGDIAVFNGGVWGHTCVIAGPVNNGYVACLGQNQGGAACPGGGAATNIVNISIREFRGAFRPKTYAPGPEPAPQPQKDCGVWEVESGDTMSGIMEACNGYVNWDEMNAYADKWISLKINPDKSVYWGWTHGTGYGLFAGDTIVFTER